MKFTMPHVTPARMIEAQREHNAEPRPWQMFYQPETATLCRIRRNPAGEILYVLTEGPLDEAEATARMLDIMEHPLEALHPRPGKLN